MSAIGPGDFVECVDAGGAQELTCGAVYRVRDVEHDIADPGSLGVRLVEVETPKPWTSYRGDRFRPIYRPKSSLIEQLKRPVGEPA